MCENTPYTESDVLEFDWIVLVNGAIVQHLHKLEHISPRNKLVAKSYLASISHEVIHIQQLKRLLDLVQLSF